MNRSFKKDKFRMRTLRHRLPITFLGLGLAVATMAQPSDCTPDYAQQVSTSWKRQATVATKLRAGFPKQTLPAIYARQEKLLDLFQHAYPNPSGLEARAYRNFYSSPDDYRLEPTGSPLHYSVVTYYKHFWCFRGKVELSGETGTWLECYVNMLWRFMDSIGSEFTLPNGQKIYFLPDKTGELKGYPIYSTQRNDRTNPRESIVITADGRLPVRPVSREEFIRSLQRTLQQWIKENDETTLQLEASLKESTAYADKIPFKTEAERQKYKDDNRRSVEDGRKIRDKTAQKNRIRYQELEAMLAAMTPAQRSSQAIIENATGMLLNEREQGTFDEQAKNGHPLVTHDFAYSDPKLPRHAIQFVQLWLRYEDAPDMVAKRELMRQFRQNIDLDGFRALIEKK
ncbi:hypothetical protein G8759_09400 [Spirosoma aureum]|uniref:Uncharacterized protein n=1 Tax=Spirosoma aureum TaxID=2692134 RepID=A0A6G9AKF5_9BACT|nr:hypothetical protein [Spirosoma aureum]QIP12824.1 hypothetical protein G8759_09400 [Spirosoma aureum]